MLGFSYGQTYMCGKIYRNEKNVDKIFNFRFNIFYRNKNSKCGSVMEYITQFVTFKKYATATHQIFTEWFNFKIKYCSAN